jgi:hypothetical protein
MWNPGRLAWYCCVVVLVLESTTGCVNALTGVDPSATAQPLPTQTVSVRDFVTIQVDPMVEGADGVVVRILVNNHSRFSLVLLSLQIFLRDQNDKTISDGFAKFNNIRSEDMNSASEMNWNFRSLGDANRELNTMKMRDIYNWRFDIDNFQVLDLNTGKAIDGRPYVQLRSVKRTCQVGLIIPCTTQGLQ